LHEFYAGAEADGVSLSALAVMLGVAGGQQATLWARHEALGHETGMPHPAGLAELGFDPAHLLLIRARDAPSALQAGLEGARCAALGAVIIELRGETRAYDLTASRRLALAARASGVRVFMVRSAATPMPSAAETRWLARAAPSHALAAMAPGIRAPGIRAPGKRAPGQPAFHLVLLRARNGQEGLQHHLEWNRDAQRLESGLSASGDAAAARQPDGGASAPLSRRMVAVPVNRPDTAHDEARPHRRAG
jgi:protein ImuA